MTANLVTNILNNIQIYREQEWGARTIETAEEIEDKRSAPKQSSEAPLLYVPPSDACRDSDILARVVFGEESSQPTRDHGVNNGNDDTRGSYAPLYPLLTSFPGSPTASLQAISLVTGKDTSTAYRVSPEQIDRFRGLNCVDASQKLPPLRNDSSTREGWLSSQTICVPCIGLSPPDEKTKIGERVTKALEDLRNVIYNNGNVVELSLLNLDAIAFWVRHQIAAFQGSFRGFLEWSDELLVESWKLHEQCVLPPSANNLDPKSASFTQDHRQKLFGLILGRCFFDDPFGFEIFYAMFARLILLLPQENDVVEKLQAAVQETFRNVSSPSTSLFCSLLQGFCLLHIGISVSSTMLESICMSVVQSMELLLKLKNRMDREEWSLFWLVTILSQQKCLAKQFLRINAVGTVLQFAKAASIEPALCVFHPSFSFTIQGHLIVQQPQFDIRGDSSKKEDLIPYHWRYVLQIPSHCSIATLEPVDDPIPPQKEMSDETKSLVEHTETKAQERTASQAKNFELFTMMHPDLVTVCDLTRTLDNVSPPKWIEKKNLKATNDSAPADWFTGITTTKATSIASRFPTFSPHEIGSVDSSSQAVRVLFSQSSPLPNSVLLQGKIELNPIVPLSAVAKFNLHLEGSSAGVPSATKGSSCSLILIVENLLLATQSLGSTSAPLAPLFSFGLQSLGSDLRKRLAWELCSTTTSAAALRLLKYSPANAMGDLWQTIVRHLFAVLVLFTPCEPFLAGQNELSNEFLKHFESNAQALSREWLTTWRERLQGATNEKIRAKLCEICSFVVQNAQTPPESSPSNPKELLQHIRVLLQQFAASENVPQELEKIKSDLVAQDFASAPVPQLVNYLKDMLLTSNASTVGVLGLVFQKWLTGTPSLLSNVGRQTLNHYLFPYTGAATRFEIIRRAVWKFIEQLSKRSTELRESHFLLMALTSPSFDIRDKQEVLLCVPFRSIIEEIQRCSNCPSWSGIGLPLLDSSCTSNKRTIKIFPSVRSPGIVQVDRSDMGHCHLRGSRSWAPRAVENSEAPSAYYFEVEVACSSIRDIQIGLCDPHEAAEENRKAKAPSHRPAEAPTAVAAQRKRRKLPPPPPPPKPANIFSAKFAASTQDPEKHRVKITQGDVLGCGYVPSEWKIFFTLNGVVIGVYVIKELLHDAKGRLLFTRLLPFVTFESIDKSTIRINFGQERFVFDAPLQAAVGCFCSSSAAGSLLALLATENILFPFLFSDEQPPSNSDLGCTSKVQILDVILPLLKVGENAPILPLILRRFSAVLRTLLSKSTVRVTTKVVAEWVQNALYPTLFDRFFATREVSVLCFAEELSRLVPFPEAICDKVLLLLGEAENNVHREVADKREETNVVWDECTDEVSSFVGNLVTIDTEFVEEDSDDEEHSRRPPEPCAHAVGQRLPPDGISRFEVTIVSNDSSVHVPLMGQFYIGVTSEVITKFANRSWKTSDPPSVWALHSELRGQLLHADETALGTDPMVFTSGTSVQVIVDRFRGTVSFSKESGVEGAALTLFKDVFTNIPPNVELRPFVQVVGFNARATITEGSRTAVPWNANLTQSVLYTMCRRMLLYETTCHRVAILVESSLRKATSSTHLPQQALHILGVAPDPRHVHVSRNGCGNILNARMISLSPDLRSAVVEVRSSETTKQFFAPLDDLTEDASFNYAPLALQQRQRNDEDDDDSAEEDKPLEAFAGQSHEGFTACAAAAVSHIANWCNNRLRFSLLFQSELSHRQRIIHEENHSFGKFVQPTVLGTFEALSKKNSGLMGALMQSPGLPRTYTFSRSKSTEGIQFPKHYYGKLMITPPEMSILQRITGDEGAQRQPPMYVAISNEKLPSSGLCTIRVFVEMEWMRLVPQLRLWPLTGCYIGVCSSAFSSKPRDHVAAFSKKNGAGQSVEPDMWALASCDSPTYHLPHSAQQSSNAHKFFSREIVRIEINRDTRTMEAFVSGSKIRGEIQQGIIFDNLPPPGVDLYPFVQLSSARCAAMFLPPTTNLPRIPHNSLRYAHTLREKRHTCDGCLNELLETSVEPPNWYRCNQCVDYDLCQQCFAAHCHVGHTFTHMRHTSYAPAPVMSAVGELLKKLTSGKKSEIIARNNDVEIGSVPLRLISAKNADEIPNAFGHAAHLQPSEDEYSLMLWGLYRRQGANALFDSVVSFPVFSEQSKTRRVVVGVGILKDLLEVLSPQSSVGPLSFQMCVERLQKLTPAAQLSASSSSPGKKPVPRVLLITSSASADDLSIPMFEITDTLSISLGKEGLEILRDGSVAANLALGDGSTGQLWATENIGYFTLVSEGDAALHVRIQSPTATFLNGKVSEISQDPKGATSFVRVTAGAANRWVEGSTREVRSPLVLLKQFNYLFPGKIIYVPKRTKSKGVSYEQGHHLDLLAVTHKTDAAAAVLGLDFNPDAFVEAVVIHVGTPDEPVLALPTTAIPELSCVADSVSRKKKIEAFQMNVNLDATYVLSIDNVPASQSEDSSTAYPETKARLKRYYAKYAPGKSEVEIDKALDTYAKHPKGHEGMWEALKQKYGPEPTFIDVLFPPQPSSSLGAELTDDGKSLYPKEKARLRRFYARYAPTKSEADMEKALETYAKHPLGHQAMWSALIEKYGPEPVLGSEPTTKSNTSAAVRFSVGPTEHTPSTAFVTLREVFVVSRLLVFLHDLLALPHSFSFRHDLLNRLQIALSVPSLGAKRATSPSLVVSRLRGAVVDNQHHAPTEDLLELLSHSFQCASVCPTELALLSSIHELQSSTNQLLSLSRSSDLSTTLSLRPTPAVSSPPLDEHRSSSFPKYLKDCDSIVQRLSLADINGSITGWKINRKNGTTNEKITLSFAKRTFTVKSETFKIDKFEFLHSPRIFRFELLTNGTSLEGSSVIFILPLYCDPFGADRMRGIWEVNAISIGQFFLLTKEISEGEVRLCSQVAAEESLQSLVHQNIDSKEAVKVICARGQTPDDELRTLAALCTVAAQRLRLALWTHQVKEQVLDASHHQGILSFRSLAQLGLSSNQMLQNFGHQAIQKHQNLLFSESVLKLSSYLNSPESTGPTAVILAARSVLNFAIPMPFEIFEDATSNDGLSEGAHSLFQVLVQLALRYWSSEEILTSVLMVGKLLLFVAASQKKFQEASSFMSTLLGPLEFTMSRLFAEQRRAFGSGKLPPAMLSPLLMTYTLILQGSETTDKNSPGFLPIASMKVLCQLVSSIRSKVPVRLPLVPHSALELGRWHPLGSSAVVKNGSRLVQGKARTAVPLPLPLHKAVYFEVCSSDAVRVSLGFVSQKMVQQIESTAQPPVPDPISQYWQWNPLLNSVASSKAVHPLESLPLGYTKDSIRFDGCSVMTALNCIAPDYCTSRTHLTSDDILGCLLQILPEGDGVPVVQWSINGILLAPIPLPIEMRDIPLYGVVEVSSKISDEGLCIRGSASELCFLPQGVSPLLDEESDPFINLLNSSSVLEASAEPLSHSGYLELGTLMDIENGVTSVPDSTASPNQQQENQRGSMEQSLLSALQSLSTPNNTRTKYPSLSPTLQTLLCGPRATKELVDDRLQELRKSETKLTDALELRSYKDHIRFAEIAFCRVLPMLDLDNDQSDLHQAFDQRCLAVTKSADETLFSLLQNVVTCSPARLCAALKYLARPSFRKEMLGMSVAPVRSVSAFDAENPLPTITVRWYQLFLESVRTDADTAGANQREGNTTLKGQRSPKESIAMSVLGQLYRQLGSWDVSQFSVTPMFVTALMMTESGHIPQDAGGPYKQVFTLLSEEMLESDEMKKRGFCRNPLFRTTETKENGRLLIPDRQRSSEFDFAHFQFLGKIIGHLVRSRKQTLAVDISPFVWKYLVEDEITIQDYYRFVDSSLEEDINTGALFESPVDEDVLPNYKAIVLHLEQLRGSSYPRELLQREAAEHALISSLDKQLKALRDGVREVLLSRKTLRTMTWEDLSVAVCGYPDITLDQLLSSVHCTLPEPYKTMFWDAIKNMTPGKWSKLFYFASAQKRYPLSRPITVHQTPLSITHLPVSHTCFSTVECPLYTSTEMFRQKFETCIQCQDMELA